MVLYPKNHTIKENTYSVLKNIENKIKLRSYITESQILKPLLYRCFH